MIKKKYIVKNDNSFVVGDQTVDKIFAKNIGVKYFHVKKNNDISKILKYLKNMKNKKILVLGGNGFVGKNLLKKLIKNNKLDVFATLFNKKIMK